MPTSSDVFILSAVRVATPGEALLLAVQEAGLKPARVRDLLFGWDGPEILRLEQLARQAGLVCPAVALSSSLRALCFAAQSILCEDADLVLVGGSDGDRSAALLLGSPAVVGIHNLLPLARIDTRALDGAEAALKKAELTEEELGIKLEGASGALLAVELIGALGETQARWGMVMVAEAALLLERV